MIHGVYAICDNTTVPHLRHEEIARELLTGGIRILQLRLKGENDLQKVRQIADSILRLKKEFDFTFILNDEVDLALELKTDGVHLGRDDMAVSQARKRLGKNFLIGYSSHSLEEAREAERRGADYVAFGAIFPTPLKGPGHPIQGLDRLREVVRAMTIPVVAIGGIDRTNFAAVVETGVSAVAMIRALVAAKDISSEARWFVRNFP
jgi:thiamine-phosphate pyrophosphorylase